MPSPKSFKAKSQAQSQAKTVVAQQVSLVWEVPGLVAGVDEAGRTDRKFNHMRPSMARVWDIQTPLITVVRVEEGHP